MEEAAKYIIQNITGSSQFELSTKEEKDRVIITIKADKDIIGLIIGKEGKTIKNIRKILSIAAAQAQRSVLLEVQER